MSATEKSAGYALVPAAIVTRLQVEDFLYREVELLDRWELDDWIALYTDDCRYEVAPTGKADAATLSPETSLFLIADNRFRLEQRVIRLKKPTAHAEYPHSRTRHIYSNVRILDDTGDTLSVAVNFVTTRAAKGFVQQYFGSIAYVLKASGSGEDRSFKVAFKRITLDQDNLVPQGKVTIFL